MPGSALVWGDSDLGPRTVVIVPATSIKPHYGRSIVWLSREAVIILSQGINNPTPIFKRKA